MDFEKGIQEKEPTMQDAINHIEMTKQECWQMGNNDSEIPTLQDIRKELEAGNLEPREAIRQATEVKESKIER